MGITTRSQDFPKQIDFYQAVDDFHEHLRQRRFDVPVLIPKAHTS